MEDLSSAPDRAARAAFAVILLAYLGISGWYIFSQGPLVTDDAYIFFRYADNWVRGHGLVYNPGEAVEGYTSFLWTVLLGAGIALGLPPLAFSQGLGVTLGLATLWCLRDVSRRIFPDAPFLALLPVALLAVNRTFCVWSVQGLDPRLFGALLMAVVWSWFRYGTGGPARGRVPLTGILIGLLLLARPEGYLFAGLMFLCAAWGAAAKGDGRRLVPHVLVAFAMVAAHLTFRYLTYGDLLPNTFYAKVVGPQGTRGLLYLWAWAKVSGVVVFGLLALPGLRSFLRGPGLLSQRIFLVFSTFFYGFYLVQIGGDYLGFRMIDPVQPFVFLLGAHGLRVLVDRLAPVRARRAAGAALAAAWLAVSLVALAAPKSLHGDCWTPEDEGVYTRHYGQVGRWIAANIHPPESIAIIPAGAIAYLSRVRVLDLMGLNDREIARDDAFIAMDGRVGHQRIILDIDYVRRRGVTYYLGWPRISTHPSASPLAASVEVEPGRFLHLYPLRPDAAFQPGIHRLDEHAGSTEGWAPAER